MVHLYLSTECLCLGQWPDLTLACQASGTLLPHCVFCQHHHHAAERRLQIVRYGYYEYTLDAPGWSGSRPHRLHCCKAAGSSPLSGTMRWRGFLRGPTPKCSLQQRPRRQWARGTSFGRESSSCGRSDGAAGTSYFRCHAYAYVRCTRTGQCNTSDLHMHVCGYASTLQGNAASSCCLSKQPHLQRACKL